MILEDKVAVIYGAGGAIGGACARAFAREGAKVFLTGPRMATLEGVLRDILAAGGVAEAAVVDACDERAVDEHLQAVVSNAGRVDVSFNAIGVADARILGVSLVELDAAAFALPIADYTRSYFLTARAAARHMVARKSGVIMTVTALPARMGSRLNGGYGTANAGKEARTRDLSAELAPHGVRVVGLRPHGMPETDTMREVFALKAHGTGMSWEQFTGYLAGTTHPRRVLKVAEVAEVAAFAASDRASGLTGTTLNLTMGALDD
jgi:NAD(P)-dependent dehydrogenase (short-subunit alcohol dehydrogenase family)